MSKLLSSRTSLTLTEELRTRIAELPEDFVPSTSSASEVLRQLIERGVVAAEEQAAERAYADMAAVESVYREVHRQRRTERATARERALHAEEVSGSAQAAPYDAPAGGQ
ncbi:MAG TPA: hypothetical protein H9870_08505 [Candidatus Corynebacterium avicola]|uniref:Uncharacterized protein n=1 Tax=Candidatus Corynebacterium avicola TaxID=2838527 RepID=A0A9D1RNL3_9CORY|nr:hypothetical protein [Candidatus Corynebacterium avicola]